jgi:hypothetical protein
LSRLAAEPHAASGAQSSTVETLAVTFRKEKDLLLTRNQVLTVTLSPKIQPKQKRLRKRGCTDLRHPQMCLKSEADLSNQPKVRPGLQRFSIKDSIY